MEHAHSRGTENIKGELDHWSRMVMEDIVEFTGVTEQIALQLGDSKRYEFIHRAKFKDYENPDDYYRAIGKDQIFRQMVYSQDPRVQVRSASIVNMLRSPKELTGLDFGCGISICGHEALRMDNWMDFVDLDGAAAYEFLKWRIKKHKLEAKAGFAIGGPYDFVIMNDIIEHIYPWEPVLDNICGRIGQGGAIITNLFTEGLREDDPEHLHMEKEKVSQFLLDRNFMPSHMGLWIKKDNFLGGSKNVRNIRADVSVGKGEAVGEA